MKQRVKQGERGAGITLVALVLLGVSLMVGTFIVSGKWLMDENAYRETHERIRMAAYAITRTGYITNDLRSMRHFETDVGVLPTTVQELWSRSAAVATCAMNTSADVRDMRGWCGPYITYLHSGESLADGWGRPFVIYTNTRSIRSGGPNMRDDNGAEDDIVYNFGEY